MFEIFFDLIKAFDTVNYPMIFSLKPSFTALRLELLVLSSSQFRKSLKTFLFASQIIDSGFVQVECNTVTLVCRHQGYDRL